MKEADKAKKFKEEFLAAKEETLKAQESKRHS